MADHDPHVLDERTPAVDDKTRILIRELYFMGQVPLRQIVALTGFSMQSVRGVLVLRGGTVGDGPAPSASGATHRPPLALVRSSPASAVGSTVQRRPTRRHT